MRKRYMARTLFWAFILACALAITSLAGYANDWPFFGVWLGCVSVASMNFALCLLRWVSA